MRRKFIGITYIIVLCFGTMLSLYAPKQEAAADQSIVIPKDAIRLRILANSDRPEDQAIKRKIRDQVNANITKWVQDLTSKKEAKKVIQSHLPDIEKIAKETMEKEHLNQSVKVELGKVDFPTKLYGQYLYPAGKYDAVLITLGEGRGANWWCVLYPPLCFLDFSNGVAVSEGFDEDSNKKEKTAAGDKKKTQQENTDGSKYEKGVQSKQEAEKNIRSKKYEDEKKSSVNDKDRKSVKTTAATDSKRDPVYTGSENEKIEKKLLIMEIIKKLF